MAKVTYLGHVHEIDLQALPIHEGLALQKKTGFRAIELGQALQAGDFLAMAGYAWILLKYRMHLDVEFDAICDGTYPIDFRDIHIETEEVEPDPTTGAEAKTSS